MFDAINYLKIKCCAMSTICAPASANIYVGKFENLYMYPYIKNISTFYCRVIDYIFCSWTGKESEIIKS